MSDSTGWVDVSVPLHPGVPSWPGDPPFELERVQDPEAGDGAVLSRLCMSVHTGTHLDAPLHFVRDGAPVDHLPLADLIGPARVVAMDDREQIGRDDVEELNVRPGERLLFRTSNSALWTSGRFQSEFVHLSTPAARLLAERRPRLVGIDYLSVAGYETNEAEVHGALLKAGVWVLEGLDLSAVDSGRYELLCLPLPLLGAEAAPARALLRPWNSRESALGL